MRLWCFFILSTIFFETFGQKDQVAFFEAISDDSVKLFFDHSNQFTEKSCARYVRYSRIDSNGNFDGYFKDVSLENVVIGTGHYNHGIKEGFFQVNYPDGKIFSSGFYHDNKPSGEWNYFHENRIPERTLNIIGNETLLFGLIDKKGNIMVTGGQGKFNGYVSGNSSTPNDILAVGEVQNGQPVGKWKSYFGSEDGDLYCIEEFDRGKFLQGTFPSALERKDREYKGKSILNTFFLTNYLTALESFPIKKCGDYGENGILFDQHNFINELHPKMELKGINDYKIHKAVNNSYGENFVAIRFNVNSNGQPEKFVLEKGGLQFFNLICVDLEKYARFSPETTIKYFLLRIYYKINRASNTSYDFEYKFSDTANFTNMTKPAFD